MFLSARKKAILISVGIVLIVGLGFLGWQIKGGKLFSSAATVAGQTFSDVPGDYWAFTSIEAAYRAGIVSGYGDGTFRPNNLVDRASMAVFIARAVAGSDKNVPAGPATPTYKDIPTNHWAYKYIEYVTRKRIVSGYEDGTYRPTLIITRDQMAVFISRAIAGGDSKVPADTGTPTFKDVGATYWAYKYIEYLADRGLVSGYSDGTFHPTEKVTRAQMAVFVTRAFDLISQYLIANISGKVTTSTGAALANAYLVFNEGDAIVQADATGNFNISGLDATLIEVAIYDQNGYQYESPNLDTHLISPNYGNNTINFSGLVKK